MQLFLGLKIVTACIPHQSVIRSFIIERNADLGSDRFLLKTQANLKNSRTLLPGSQGSVNTRTCRMMTNGCN